MIPWPKADTVWGNTIRGQSLEFSSVNFERGKIRVGAELEVHTQGEIIVTGTEYTIRRKVMTLAGAKFHIYDAQEKLIGFSKQKAFKLKEDIRVFTDESEKTEMLSIQARSIIDFSSAYDVVNSQSGAKLGALQRKGLASMLRDSWVMLDAAGREFGKIQEDSMGMALVRRFVPLGSLLIPQKFHLQGSDNKEHANFRTHMNPFVHKMTVTVDPDCKVDPLLVLAAGILLVAIEGRQSAND